MLKALEWLKLHHRGYRDIEIKPNNLDWMGTEEEMDLPPERMHTSTEMSIETDDCDNSNDPSVSSMLQTNPGACVVMKWKKLGLLVSTHKIFIVKPMLSLVTHWKSPEEIILVFLS